MYYIKRIFTLIFVFLVVIFFSGCKINNQKSINNNLSYNKEVINNENIIPNLNNNKEVENKNVIKIERQCDDVDCLIDAFVNCEKVSYSWMNNEKDNTVSIFGDLGGECAVLISRNFNKINFECRFKMDDLKKENIDKLLDNNIDNLNKTFKDLNCQEKELIIK